jgi:hypothetical protein
MDFIQANILRGLYQRQRMAARLQAVLFYGSASMIESLSRVPWIFVGLERERN